MIIINETTARIPRALFAKIARSILGPDYSLACIITTPSHIQRLNRTYRGKNKPTDILSFPLGKDEGEIYICPAYAKKKASQFDRSYANFILFLFIHGCVHLIGHDHGGTMERIESRIRKQFGV